MSSLLCLSELEEETCILHSELLGIESVPSSIYCVLTKNKLIIFKNQCSIVSIKRISIMDKTKIEYLEDQNRFLIIFNDLKLIFTSKDKNLIQKWVQEIKTLIKISTSFEPCLCFEYENVKISAIGNPNQDYYILIQQNDHKLHIYESIENHRLGISTHIINLKFYKIQAYSLPRSSLIVNRSHAKSLKLLGINLTFKITFKTDESMMKWHQLFLNAINNSFIDKDSRVLSDIYRNQSNKICADCGIANPEWVSINLCVTVCKSCSGMHRSLGISYSRIQSATIDKRIWEDGYLVKIIQKIGNENSNSFWYKNPVENGSTPMNGQLFIDDKYRFRIFIDKEFTNLPEEQLKDSLKRSVSSDDVFLTMKLWQSLHVHDSEFINELLLIAENSQQFLQKKYISLQPKSDSDKCNIEAILQISYNKESKINIQFRVTLLHNCISIKTEKPSMQPIKIGESFSVLYDDISIVWYDWSNECLVVYIDPVRIVNKYNGKSNNQSLSVNKISFYNKSERILDKFKNQFFQFLLPNHFVTLTDETNLFINLNVKINISSIMKYKIHLTEMELIIAHPICTIYDLKKSSRILLLENKEEVCIKFINDEILLVAHDSEIRKIIYNCLKASINLNRLFDNMEVDQPINKMIDFIKVRVLSSNDIFQINGTIKKVNELFNLLKKMKSNFIIDPNIYSVNDVASCLKKYFHSFPEPIVLNKLYDSFRVASEILDSREKIEVYKKSLSVLPKINYEILRKTIELLLMIDKADNKITNEYLANTIAGSLISFEMENFDTSVTILKDFIKNFVILFDYSDQEYQMFKIFVIDKPIQKDVNFLRTFYVSPQLKITLKIEKFDYEKMSFLGKEVNYLIVMLNLDQCSTVKDIYNKIFFNFQMDMFHFQIKKSGSLNKSIKKLIYLNDDILHTITEPRTITKYTSFFVFLPKQTFVTRIDKRLIQFPIKLKENKNQNFTLIINYPNSLRIIENIDMSEEPIYNFILSDLSIYRFFNNIKNIFILYGNDGLLKCQFSNTDDLEEFIYYYNNFRSKINKD